jgi:hypothetical protein
LRVINALQLGRLHDTANANSCNRSQAEEFLQIGLEISEHSGHEIDS